MNKREINVLPSLGEAGGLSENFQNFGRRNRKSEGAFRRGASHANELVTRETNAGFDTMELDQRGKKNVVGRRKKDNSWLGFYAFPTEKNSLKTRDSKHLGRSFRGENAICNRPAPCKGSCGDEGLEKLGAVGGEQKVDRELGGPRAIGGPLSNERD